MSELVQISTKTKYTEFVDDNPFQNSAKMLYHLDRLAKWKIGDYSQVPVNIEIFPTNYCNMACAFCISAYSHVYNPSMTKEEKNKALKVLDGMAVISNHPERKKGLDPEKMKAFFLEIKNAGVKSVTFSGAGESSAAYGFDKMVQYADDAGLEIAMMTNGAWRKKDTELIGTKMRWLRISLDTFNEEEYRKEKNTHLFNTVINNIKEIVKYPVKVGLNSNIGDYNKNSLYEFAVEAKKLKVSYVQYRPILPLKFSTSFNEKYHEIKPKKWYEEIIKDLNKAEELSDENFKVFVSYDKIQGMMENNLGFNFTKCQYHHFQCILDPNGFLQVCAYRMAEPEKFSFGNIYENTFEEIWNSEKRKKVIGYCNNSLDLENCQIWCKGFGLNRLTHFIENPNPENDINFL